MGAKHFGARVTRLEDPALLAGRGRFVDDVKLPGALHACFVRSPHAHAKLVSIDSKVALIMPGVHAVITADDLPELDADTAAAAAVAQSGVGDDENPARAGARRSLLCRPGRRRGDRGHALHRRRRGGGDDRAIRRAAGRLRLPHRRRGQCAARCTAICRRTSPPRSGWLMAIPTPPSPTPRTFSPRGSGSTAAAAWRWRRARCSPVMIRRRTCSRCGRERRRRISAAKRWPTCSAAICNRSA